jgi:hypothetical protein
MPEISLSEFLGAFFPSPDERIRLRAIKSRQAPLTDANRPVKLATTRAQLSKDKSLLLHLRRLNETRGLYFVVNSGGDSDAAITRFNSVFCERDDLPIAQQHALLDAAPLPTSVRVDTLKSVHAYWLLEGSCSQKEWREAQSRLIAFFRSDPAIRNPARLMRLPTFNHVSMSGDGLHYAPVQITQFDPARRYTPGELLAAFPPALQKSGQVSVALQTFPTWERLNDELRRRIMADPTTKQNREGVYHCRARCHDANGDTAIMFNPATGAVKCLAGCTHSALLRSFGLPERPDANKVAEAPANMNEAASEGALRIVCMAEVEPEEVRWLWHPYIPHGKLTILEGDPGLGKSWLTCALAAAVSRGRGLPGAEPFEPANVLMLSAEDGLGDTLRPRLDAVGADVSHVFALNEPVTLDGVGLVRLEAVIIDYGPALVIIDPLFAYTGGKVDIHRANECRAISAPLAAMAERQGCAILVVRHLTKSSNRTATNAGLGSIDFRAAARSVLLAGANPEDQRRRAVVQTKNNLDALGDALGYKIEGKTFYWTGKSDLTAERLLAAPAGEEVLGERAEATEFLQAALADGSRPAKDIKQEASQLGLSEQMLRTARRRLGVRSHKEGGRFGSKKQLWVWELPTAAEDVTTDGEQHLQLSCTANSRYTNGLAEEVVLTGVQHVLSAGQHLQSGNGRTSSAGMGICECGASGLRYRHCKRCGSFIIASS